MDQIKDKQALYLQTIKTAYPDLDIRSSRLHTGEGQFNYILFVNDDLIFRFPRYEASIGAFLQELKILQKLQGFVRLSIPDPIYAPLGATSVGDIFMGYKLLPGKPLFRKVLLEVTDGSTLDTLAGQLADFLHDLHHLCPATLGLDLPVDDQATKSRELFSGVKEYLFPFMRPDARDSVRRHFEDYFDRPDLHEYAPSIIHGDFGGSNILFDGDKITGIIDFSFAGLGDPAQDIAAVSTYGKTFFVRICRHYPGIESLLEQAAFYRGTFALQEALHGFLNNDKQAFTSGMEEYV